VGSNGSATYISATGLTALSNVTITPNTPANTWAVNVYAYNSGYSLIASNVTQGYAYYFPSNPVPDMIWFKMANSTSASGSTGGGQFFNEAVGNNIGNGTLWYNVITTTNGTNSQTGYSGGTGPHMSAYTTNTYGSGMTTPYFSLPSTVGSGYTVCFWFNDNNNLQGSPFMLFTNGTGTQTNNCVYTMGTGGYNISVVGTSGGTSTPNGNNQGVPEYFTNNGTSTAFTSSVSSSTWYHFAFTNTCVTNNSSTGGTCAIFFNGAQVGSSFTGTYSSGNASNMIGLWAACISCKIGDFRMYSSPLSATTIASIYNATK